jgi:hypothetical protein
MIIWTDPNPLAWKLIVRKQLNIYIYNVRIYIFIYIFTISDICHNLIGANVAFDGF